MAAAMAQRVLALAAEEGPERLQEALQGLGEDEVRGRGPPVTPHPRAGGSPGGVWGAWQLGLLVAAGRDGDEAGPEGQGDGGAAEGDLQRWVVAGLGPRRGHGDLGGAVGSSTGCEGRLWGEPGGCKRDVTARSDYAVKRELE